MRKRRMRPESCAVTVWPAVEHDLVATAAEDLLDGAGRLDQVVSRATRNGNPSLHADATGLARGRRSRRARAVPRLARGESAG